MQSNPVYVQVHAVPMEETGKLIAEASSNDVAVAIHAAPQAAAARNETGIREYLSANKWPVGLQDTFIQNLSKVAVRFFICDDSGSMSSDDGHCLVEFDGVSRFRSCTRWKELSTALAFHAKLAKIARAPSEFRLLNGAPPLVLGELDEEDKEENLSTFLRELQRSPSGGTPLCAHIREVIQQIQAMAPQLRAHGQKACVVIASDGESSDGDVAAALKPLEHLPAWVVIRLCTDEERIVNYWNNIDNDLELEMDVLDDLEGEAEEIHEVNPWLTYGEPLHRLREFGIPIKEIDLLDEKALNSDQIRLFCSLLFGGSVDNYPHPLEEWKEFQEMITIQNRRSGYVFSAITKKLALWIDLGKVPRKTSFCKTVSFSSSGGSGGGCLIM